MACDGGAHLSGRTLRAPVWAQPGCADGSVTVHLATAEPKPAAPAPAPASILTACARQSAVDDTGLAAKKTAGSYLLATTQNEHALDPKRISCAPDLADYLKNPASVHEGAEDPHQP